LAQRRYLTIVTGEHELHNESSDSLRIDSIGIGTDPSANSGEFLATQGVVGNSALSGNGEILRVSGGALFDGVDLTVPAIYATAEVADANLTAVINIATTRDGATTAGHMWSAMSASPQGHASDDSTAYLGAYVASPITKNSSAALFSGFGVVNVGGDADYDYSLVSLGGDLNLAAFNTAGDTNGPSVSIEAADAVASGNGDGGSIALTPGAKDGTGADGSVLIGNPSTNAAALDFDAGSACDNGPSGGMRLRYNQGTNKGQLSLNGASFVDIATGSIPTLEWTRSSTVLYPSESTVNKWQFDTSVSGATICIDSNSSTAANLTIHAQDTSSGEGGDIIIASGAGTTGTPKIGLYVDNGITALVDFYTSSQVATQQFSNLYTGGVLIEQAQKADDGADMSIKAQTSTSGTGGDLNLYAGGATTTAGDVNVYSGNGSTDGQIVLHSASSEIWRAYRSSSNPYLKGTGVSHIESTDSLHLDVSGNYLYLNVPFYAVFGNDSSNPALTVNVDYDGATGLEFANTVTSAKIDFTDKSSGNGVDLTLAGQTTSSGEGGDVVIGAGSGTSGTPKVTLCGDEGVTQWASFYNFHLVFNTQLGGSPAAGGIGYDGSSFEMTDATGTFNPRSTGLFTQDTGFAYLTTTTDILVAGASSVGADTTGLILRGHGALALGTATGTALPGSGLVRLPQGENLGVTFRMSGYDLQGIHLNDGDDVVIGSATGSTRADYIQLWPGVGLDINIGTDDIIDISSTAITWDDAVNTPTITHGALTTGVATHLTIEAQSNSGDGGSYDAGDLLLNAGSQTSSGAAGGDGGNVVITAGDSTKQSAGSITLETPDAASGWGGKPVYIRPGSVTHTSFERGGSSKNSFTTGSAQTTYAFEHGATNGLFEFTTQGTTDYTEFKTTTLRVSTNAGTEHTRIYASGTNSVIESTGSSGEIQLFTNSTQHYTVRNDGSIKMETDSTFWPPADGNGYLGSDSVSWNTFYVKNIANAYDITFDSSHTTPTIKHEDTNSGAGDPLEVWAQTTSDSEVGGTLELHGGDGGSSDGPVEFYNGSTLIASTAKIDENGYGFLSAPGYAIVVKATDSTSAAGKSAVLEGGAGDGDSNAGGNVLLKAAQGDPDGHVKAYAGTAETLLLSHQVCKAPLIKSEEATTVWTQVGDDNPLIEFNPADYPPGHRKITFRAIMDSDSSLYTYARLYEVGVGAVTGSEVKSNSSAWTEVSVEIEAPADIPNSSALYTMQIKKDSGVTTGRVRGAELRVRYEVS